MREHSELTLRNQVDFNRVYKKGNSKGSKYVVVLYVKNNKDFTRTAFVASKKVGNSVMRNRARRLMKAAFCKMNVKNGYDIVFVARNTISGEKEESVEKSMFGALRAAELNI